MADNKFMQGVKIKRLYNKCPHDYDPYDIHRNNSSRMSKEFFEFVNYTKWLTVMGLLETRNMLYGI